MIAKLRLLIVLMFGFIPFGLALANSSAGAAVNVFPLCDDQNRVDQTTVVCQQKKDQTTKKNNPVIDALRVTLVIMSYIVGVSAVIVVIVSGIRMVTASGDAQSFAKARSSILYALVALMLVALAQVIVAFVLNKL